MEQSDLGLHFMGVSRGGGPEGGGGPDPHWNNMWQKVCFEILVRTPLKKQLDPSGPIASRGRSAHGPL